MKFAGAPDILQEKMSDLMRNLEYARTHIEDLLIITMGTFEKYLTCLEVFLKHQKKISYM